MVTFVLDSFEQVAALPETVLLRVIGHWQSQQREPISMPLLVIDDGRDIHRFSTLPGPDESQPVADPEGNELWRGAFSVPRELVEAVEVAFALETAGGKLFDLPQPKDIALRTVEQREDWDEGEMSGAAVNERRRRAQAERQAEEYRRSSVENATRFETERAARRQLEQQQQENTRQLESAQTQVHTLQARLDGLQAELRAANELAQAAREEAQSAAVEAADARNRLSERDDEFTKLRLREERATQQLADTQQLQNAHEAKVKGLQADLLAAQTELDRANQQQQQHGSELEAVRGELTTLITQVQTLENERALLNAELEKTRTESQNEHQEVEQLRAQVERLTTASQTQQDGSAQLAQDLEQARQESSKAQQQLQILADQVAAFEQDLARKTAENQADGDRISALTVELEQVQEAQRQAETQRKRAEKERDTTLRELAFAKESGTKEAATEAQLAELRATHEAQLRSQQQLAEATTNDLKTEVEQLQAQLEQTRGEREYGHAELERRAVDAERRLQRLAQELEQTNAASAQLRQQAAQLAQKATKLDTRASQAERRANDLERKLATVRNRPPANIGQRTKNTGELEKGHLTALERERDLALNRLERLERDRLEPLRARLEQVARERDEAVARIKDYSGSNKQTAVSKQEFKKLQAQLKQLTLERENLLKEKQTRDQSVRSLEESLAKLQAEVRDEKSSDGADGAVQKIQLLQEQLAAKETQLQEHADAVRALQEANKQLDVLQQKVKEYEGDRQSSGQRLAALEQELIELRSARSHLQEQNRQLSELTTSERTSELEAEIARLHNELDQRSDELLNQSNESDSVGQLRWEVEALRTNLSERDQALAQAQATLASLHGRVVQAETAEHALPALHAETQQQLVEASEDLLAVGTEDQSAEASEEFESVDGQFRLEPDKRSRFALILLIIGGIAALALLAVFIWVVVLGR